MSRPKPIDAVLIAAGPWHDIDFARLEVLRYLQEHERLRVRVFETYEAAMPALAGSDVLLTYTCNLVPGEAAIGALETFVEDGGRWFALHGTNSALVLDGDKPVHCPPLPERFLDLLGSQFMAHPAPGTFKVSVAAPDHPLTQGIGTFFVEDEHYLQRHLPGNDVLLSTRFEGRTPLFEQADWPEGDHQVMYLRPRGRGAVLYLTLGHARGRYDMRPLTDSYPFVERGSWAHPVFQTLLRRGIAWAMAARD
ncbi:ThuA domain-containing protein [Roseibacterium sp. SDUM158016]|uniref:ThuA domain-containing protein n=1 Tax=Roseicyclus sediminis TaxID=2980997 RepID=UPI0021D3E2F9|nr:ThuA domain-containing protein [Roseibacterium sp. SDUM158016]MCU4652093.1 ThuA domain-containing protein [Roseibacterium sp. SDUM158016]